MSDFMSRAERISEKIHELRELYSGFYPDFVELEVRAVCNDKTEHNWIAHTMDNFDLTGKEGPVTR